MRLLFWLALGLVAYTYVGYGAIVGFLARLRPIVVPLPPQSLKRVHMSH